MIITIIDYKAGNIGSVQKAVRQLGYEALMTEDPDVIRKAERILLPGVGHFSATRRLNESGMRPAIEEAIARGTPFMGICVGLQWMFEGSTEAPGVSGLGCFRGCCDRFHTDLKVPHVGWNSLRRTGDSQLLKGVPQRSVCLFHALLSRARGRWRGCHDHLRRGVRIDGRARQRLRRAVPPGKIGRSGAAHSEEFLRGCMLTKRIIACLDVTNGRVVKGVQFLDLRDAGDPAELAHRHAESGADEVVLLDITATHESRPILIDAVRRAARELFVPFTVGGGVRTLADAAVLFEAGADKITMNSAAVRTPELITEVAERFGSQAVVVAIDAKRGNNSGRGSRGLRLRRAAFRPGSRFWIGRAKSRGAARAKSC